jgi:hypothetical protein
MEVGDGGQDLAVGSEEAGAPPEPRAVGGQWTGPEEAGLQRRLCSSRRRQRQAGELKNWDAWRDPKIKT